MTGIRGKSSNTTAEMMVVRRREGCPGVLRCEFNLVLHCEPNLGVLRWVCCVVSRI